MDRKNDQEDSSAMDHKNVQEDNAKSQGFSCLMCEGEGKTYSSIEELKRHSQKHKQPQIVQDTHASGSGGGLSWFRAIFLEGIAEWKKLSESYLFGKGRFMLRRMEWQNYFDRDGRLVDGGAFFLKKVHSGNGIHPSIRHEVWPFIIGMYDLSSTTKEREVVFSYNMEEYRRIRNQCCFKLESSNSSNFSEDAADDSVEEASDENFARCQRRIRVDALRVNGDWVNYSDAAQTSVSESMACSQAERVGLMDYEGLEVCKILHGVRLVELLEVYAMYDPEIGYCQGMTDLLSPIMSVMDDDHQAFWCFVCLMDTARDNFKVDGSGIRRQLNSVSDIIKGKDPVLYSHLQSLQAQDCLFVFSMVLVLLRRNLPFEQTLHLWEVIWANLRQGQGLDWKTVGKIY